MGFASLADESGIHGDHVMLSEELRRQMGMEVTGRVLLRSLSADRMCTEPSTLTFYPLFSMVNHNLLVSLLCLSIYIVKSASVKLIFIHHK